VRRQSPASDDKGFHIGLRYNPTFDRLQWADGRTAHWLSRGIRLATGNPPDYLLPVKGEGKGECVVVSLEKDSSGDWYSEKCDALRPAVCERLPAKIQ
jgi:hypothetical protein